MASREEAILGQGEEPEERGCRVLPAKLHQLQGVIFPHCRGDVVKPAKPMWCQERASAHVASVVQGGRAVAVLICRGQMLY